MVSGRKDLSELRTTNRLVLFFGVFGLCGYFKFPYCDRIFFMFSVVGILRQINHEIEFGEIVSIFHLN